MRCSAAGSRREGVDLARPVQAGFNMALDMRKKSAIVKIVDEKPVPDQPPSSTDIVAFADVWRPVPANRPPALASLPPSFNLQAVTPATALPSAVASGSSQAP
jgi:hypothetical protein